MQNTIKQKITFLFFLLFSSGFIQAQNSISGKVTDDFSNTPLESVKIKVVGANNGAISDAKGQFKINNVGTVFPITLTCTLFGYTTMDVIVNNEKDSVFIKMNPENVKKLETVNVRSGTSEKEKVSALSIETMSLAEIKATPALDFYEGLSHMKGVDLTSASIGFKVINTRGFNSTSPVRTLQLIDGVDNASPGLSFSLGNFLGASELDIMQVDIISGASSAFYGPNAFNGVISMNTKNPFKFQGFSASVKAGERFLNEYSVRYAKAYQFKKGRDIFAYKLNVSYMRANDWEANNNNSVENLDTDRNNPGGYDAVNRYGDENLSPNINNALDLSAVWQTPGLRRWHRTGYWERDVVDYKTENLKAAAAFHFMLKPKVELIFASNFGTGTTVYQGDNRFSLKDILFFQNRIEIQKKDDFFVRVYATNEDAGNSYDAVLTAFLLQDAAASDANWQNRYRQYWSSNITSRVRALDPSIQWTPVVGSPADYDGINQVVNANPDSMYAWHQEARAFADSEFSNLEMSDYFKPGTQRFDSLLNDITTKTSFLEGGSRIVDKSALYHIHAEKVFNTDFAKFTVGGNGRIYNPRSGGSLFSDTNGIRILNKEFGVYAGLDKKFADEKWIVRASIRVDKNENFDFLPSPAASLIWQPSKQHTLKGTVTSAIRNPTLLNQYMYYNVGRAKLLGNINGYDSLVTIESIRDCYSTLVPNIDTLDYFNLDPIAPEKVKSFEISYKGVFLNKLFVDLSYYFNSYTNFIGFVNGADVFVTPNNTLIIQDVYRIATNSKERITTQGVTIGLNYYLTDNYSLSGNYSWNRLNKESGDPIIPAYNTPENKVNFGFQGKNIAIKKITGLGFNINYKWIQGFLSEGSPQFTGNIPSYGLMDAQVNKLFEKAKLTLKLGASNLLNNNVLQVFGGPYVGRMVYVSLSFDMNNK
ncbi:MAG: TonB-dependent receptor [Flavobacteriales bacterium]|nr:TonB-dependent receptor [Flavobacteriales bacterium]